MKIRIIAIAVGLLLLAALLFAGKSIREAHYPLPIKPSASWESYISSLDVQREAFFVDSDGVMLEADLFIPNGGRAGKPAVVFSPGSGDSLYQNYAPGFVETYILDLFLARDFAVLLVNKRGMGQSEGNYTKSSIEGRAADLYAAVQSVQSHPGIDEENIGLIGHSQGGWVVGHTAAEHADIAFFISLAGPTMTMFEQGADMYAHEGRCTGLEDEALDAYVAKRTNRTRLGIRIGEIINFGMFGFDARSQHYNPKDALTTVANPGLFVYAEKDFLVTPALNIARMNEIFAGDIPPHIRMVMVDDATHIFRLVDDPCDSAADPEAYPLSTQLTDILHSWLTEQGY
jgi:pimeloyl-ACP methyl ester carboxylesterase